MTMATAKLLAYAMMLLLVAGPFLWVWLNSRHTQASQSRARDAKYDRTQISLILEQMPVPLVLTSDNDVEVFRNRAAEDLLRASGALQRTGIPTSQLLADWTRRCAGREDQGLRNLDDFRAWIAADAPVPLMIGDSVRHFYEIRRQLIPDIGVLWTILDISRHKQLELALRITTDNLEQRVRERTRALEDAREGAERAFGVPQ